MGLTWILMRALGFRILLRLSKTAPSRSEDASTSKQVDEVQPKKARKSSKSGKRKKSQKGTRQAWEFCRLLFGQHCPKSGRSYIFLLHAYHF